MEAWYAIRVRSNCERSVESALAGRGFECFLPVCRRLSRWSDRLKKIESPLFAGYLFGRFESTRRLPILTTPGVLHIVGNSGGPLPVEEQELASIRVLMQSGRTISPWPYLRAGDVVTVARGPFAGARATLLRVKDEYRLIASLSLLQRSVAVELDRDAVELVERGGVLANSAVSAAAGC